MVDATDISRFRGIVPRESCAGLPANYARRAEDVDLRRGCLESWRVPASTVRFDSAICRAFHTCDCCWIGSASPCAKYLTATICNTTVLSGADYPTWTDSPCTDDDWCRMGLPKPDMPLIMGGATIENEFTALRDYIITFCNECAEGQPSMPSNSVKANKDDPIHIELPDAPPEWCITHINIYRLMPIQDVTPEAYLHPELSINNQQVLLNQDVEADYFLIASVPVGTEFITDVGEFLCKERKLLRTTDHLPPPKCLCIVDETRNGSLVGFVKGERDVHFSRRNCPHYWPVKDKITIEKPIEHVCVCDNTVYVFTCGALYIMEDTNDPALPGCRRPQRSKCPLSLCCSESVVKTERGVLFASREGYILAGPDGSYQNLTSVHFAPRDWNLIEPCSIRAAKHEGQLFFSSNKGTWIMDLNLEGIEGATINLTTSSLIPTHYVEGMSGELYMLMGNEVVEWNAGNDFMDYTWDEAAQNPCDEGTVTDARVIFDDLERHKHTGAKTQFTLYNDNGQVYTRPIDHSKPFKVCTNRSEETRISVSGTATVKRVKYGVGRNCLYAVSRGAA